MTTTTHHSNDVRSPINLKYMSLAVLCVQNSALAIIMRLARVGDEKKFNSSTAVIMSEVFKITLCVYLVLRENNHLEDSLKVSSFTAIWNTINDPKEMIRMSIPAILYLLQNNLQFIAIANLNPATYQVLYQLKILTTAFFSVLLLGKRLSKMQWGAILVLMIGVAIVQQNDGSTVDKEAKLANGDADLNMTLGLLCVLLACCCSGFAGVFFEKILKNTVLKASIWERNIQMGIISLFFGLVSLLWSESQFLNTKGFFYGYRSIVWVCIGLHAFGGLLTAVVVKYADNIMKAFATSLAIVLSCILSFFLFTTITTFGFVVGAFLVNISVAIYGAYPYRPQPTSSKSGTNVLPINR